MRKNTHDPFRTQRLDVPQLSEPIEGAPMLVGRPLNVLAYVDRYPPTVNAGAEWYLHHALRDLVRRGHDVRVATYLPTTGVGELARIERFDEVQVWSDTLVDTLADDADVLIGHLLWTREVVELANARGIPLVYVLHNDLQIAHWNLTADNVTVMVANSEWVAASIPWKVPTAVVRPVVLLDDYALDGDAYAREFVTLVNPNPDKGAHVFYSLAHTQKRRRYMAVAGGYGQQLRPRHADTNVEWQHSTPNMRDDVYGRTRVLLVPSNYESWGRVAVEAMAAGCVVVAHPTPGLLEALDGAAMFVDRDDLKGWQGALDALDDPATFAQWSTLARARAAFLDEQARSDLDVWERTLQVAASAKGVPSAP